MSQKLDPDQIQNLLTNLPPGSKIEIKKTSQGDLVMSENHKTKQQLLEEKYGHLKGKGISLTEAAKKYEVPRGAVKGWVYQSKYVSFVDQSAYPQLVDEAEVALCAGIYKERKAINSAGLPYFDDDGRVITEAQRPASSRRSRKRKK